MPYNTTVSDAMLLQVITTGLPESFWQHYRALIQKRNAQTLSELEHQELIELSDQTEELTLQRTQALVELATRRNTTVQALRLQFGLQPVSLHT